MQNLKQLVPDLVTFRPSRNKMPSMEALIDTNISTPHHVEQQEQGEQVECKLTTITTTTTTDEFETTTTTIVTETETETVPSTDPTPDAHQLFDEMSEGECENSEDEDNEEEEEEDEESPLKKQKSLSSLTPQPPPPTTPLETLHTTPTTTTTTTTTTPSSKKSKKKTNGSVWTKSSSRKGKKKGKSNNTTPNATPTNPSDTVLITPVARFPDKSDDSVDMKICLSKVYKAEKIELSEDRLTAGSSKGYRMVRATRGVVEGAWYFEIKVVKLGETGHTRLGWAMEKGDLQAPVGYDGNSFGYRDVDGSKVHKAMREKYGDGGYVEGDVIGVYINLPDGGLYAPKPPQYVWYKGQKYMCAPDGGEELPKVVPGSEISFFKNGVCQGVAFQDLYGGRYYPAASMYTLPNQPNCVVNFNFGPEFEYFPLDFGYRPLPCPMIEVPYLSLDTGVENGISDDKKT